MKKRIIIFLIFSAFMLKPSFVMLQETKDYIPGIIHIHSNYSTGKYSIEKIARLAREKGIKVVIMTDHNLIKLEYGLFPLRGLLRRRINETSILSKTPESYLKDIENINRQNDDVLIIPGCEVAPFYYWEGSLLKKHLELKDWDRHILLIGIDNAEDFRKIPQIGSKANRSFHLSSLLFFWPIALMIIGWKLTTYKREKKIKLQRIIIKKKKTYRWQGIFIILISLLFLINYFPFTQERYNIYDGYAGYAPYQKVIDFAQEKDILAFWAHPESSSTRDFGIVKFKTDKYPEILSKTIGYNGFAALYEGWRNCANPGGYWDEILNDFLQGKRDKPIWCFGELDYHFEGETRKSIDQVQTIFLTNKVSKKRILDCLKKGKMYTFRRTKDYYLSLEEFYLTAENKRAISGQTLVASEAPRIIAQIKAQPNSDQKIKLKLIRNGKIIKEIQANSSLQLDYYDDTASSLCYYRLDITTRYPHQLYSNPIFFRWRGKN